MNGTCIIKGDRFKSCAANPNSLCMWLQEAFGPATFFVTEMLLGGQAELTNGALRIPGGILVRGNLRTSREEAFDSAEAAIKRMFGALAPQLPSSASLHQPMSLSSRPRERQ